MDPFSADGELVNIHTAYVQGRYQSVLDDFETSNFSSTNELAVRVLRSRAQLALGQAAEVQRSISDSEASKIPDLAAVKAYAAYQQNPSNAAAVTKLEQLTETASDNLTVQLLGAALLARTGKAEQALALLAKHQGSLDAVALAVQIQLSLNRSDLALKEAKAARSFAQDALLVNLAESWIGMRQGGENYQKAFYVFEELAQAPSSTSATSLVAQSVSELHMGRLEEAETALNQALALEPDNSAAVANKIVLDTIAGRSTAETTAKLSTIDKEHELLVELAAKREAFQTAMAKYSPKFVE